MHSLDSAVVSLSMDELNNEGLLGTAKGSIYFVNFTQRQLVRLVTSACLASKISHLHVVNKKLLLSSAADEQEVKVWAG